MAKKRTEQDLRVPVLLVLAAIIPVLPVTSLVGRFPPEKQDPASQYYLVPAAVGDTAKVLRIPADKAGRIKLPPGSFVVTPDIPCGAVSSELTQLFNLPLPVNQADQKSLMQLRGVGPKLADRIIAFRETQGPISGPDDFIRVKGIGPKLTARLSPLLCFTPAETKP